MRQGEKNVNGIKILVRNREKFEVWRFDIQWGNLSRFNGKLKLCSHT